MRVLIIVTSLISVCLAELAWEPLGPNGGNFYEMGVAASDDDIVYLAGDYVSSGSGWCIPVYRSTDAGGSWLWVGGIYDLYIDWANCIAVHPVDPDTVFLSVEHRGLPPYHAYRSFDGGVTWAGMNLPDSCEHIEELAVHAVSSAVYAVGQHRIGAGYDSLHVALYTSIDAGATWSLQQLTPDTCSGRAYSIALDPSDPDIMYIGAYYNCNGITYSAIYKSTDGGMSFVELTSGLPSSTFYGMKVEDIAVHYSNSDLVYAAISCYDSTGGIYRSTDGGSSWSLVHAEQYITSVAVTAADSLLVYGCDVYGDSILKSTDAGASWFRTGTGIPEMVDIAMNDDIAVRNDDASMLYYANYAGFFRSTDGGVSWLESVSGFPSLYMFSLGVAPSAPDVFYTSANFYQGHYRTVNCGDDWQRYYLGNETVPFVAIAVHNTDPDIVFGLAGYN